MNELEPKKLAKCYSNGNCILEIWEFNNLNIAFETLVQICTILPRTSVITESNTYWHAICRSLVFRFPDDLQILKQTKNNTIQIKSSSRYGAYDLGVNKNRLLSIYKELNKNGIFKNSAS
tara:strand:- start:634 stop:993 length:360 start_codon:yes stop_codon:yes gene_type:complete